MPPGVVWPRQARLPRQGRQGLLLTVSCAGRFLCVAVRALGFDTCFKHLEDFGGGGEEKRRWTYRTRASVAAEKFRTTDHGVSIAPRFIFDDINYGARADRRAGVQKSCVTNRRKPVEERRSVMSRA